MAGRKFNWKRIFIAGPFLTATKQLHCTLLPHKSTGSVGSAGWLAGWLDPWWVVVGGLGIGLMLTPLKFITHSLMLPFQYDTTSNIYSPVDAFFCCPNPVPCTALEPCDPWEAKVVCRAVGVVSLRIQFYRNYVREVDGMWSPIASAIGARTVHQI